MMYGSQLGDVRAPTTDASCTGNSIRAPRTPVKGVSLADVQVHLRATTDVAIPETMGERIKAALKEAGLTVTAAAVLLGVKSRSAFSTRINASKVDEPELLRIAELTGRAPG